MGLRKSIAMYTCQFKSVISVSSNKLIADKGTIFLKSIFIFISVVLRSIKIYFTFYLFKNITNLTTYHK